MFRVTPRSITNNTVFNIRTRNAQIAQAQKQLSSGIRIDRPSADPFGFAEVSYLKREIRTLETESSNMQDSTAILNQSVSSLQEVTTILTRAKQISQQAPQITDQAERNALSNEVGNLIERMEEIVNTQFNGNYIFAGTSVETKPFSLEETSGGGIDRVRYHGDGGSTKTVVSGDILAETYFPGSEIFLRDQRTDPLILGNTGIQPGQGTNSGIGRSTILVETTRIRIHGTSGLDEGTNTEDHTILGARGVNKVQITDTAGDGSAGTISLNNGVRVGFTSADDNLRLTGPQGEIVYVNTQNIIAGFDGEVDLSGFGQMSIDGGQSYVEIDHTDNQKLTHAETGDVTYVDTTNAVVAGNAHIEYSGTSGAITALLELREDIDNDRNLDNQDLVESFGRRLGDIDDAIDSTLEYMGSFSVDLENMEILDARNQSAQVDFQTLAIETESVDYASLIVQMQESMNILQFAYRTTATLQSTSILNYL